MCWRYPTSKEEFLPFGCLWLAEVTKDTDKDDVHAIYCVLVVVQIDRVVCVHQDLALLLPPPRVLQTGRGRNHSGVYINWKVSLIYST